MWFRRDLRLYDNPALNEAAASGSRVVPLFVIDPALWDRSGPVRQAYLLESLRALDRDLDGGLLVLRGPPSEVVPRVAAAAGAGAVHIASDFGPYGRRRDDLVEAALTSTPLIRTGSPFAVAPGRVRKDDGDPYRVFTPFYRAWLRHGWRSPAEATRPQWWLPFAGEDLPDAPDLGDLVLPEAGERAAWTRWETFRTTGIHSYSRDRNRPDLDGTSALGQHLKYGEIHPRSLLAELGADAGPSAYRRELCWREFYADVLLREPRSSVHSLDRRFDDDMRWASGDDAERGFAAWSHGRTGYPFVDAGMRQLRAEGWMHNRVRMVVASFLVKDLHLPWQRGAAEFMHWLRDGDLASNAHGWQWTAGCGTDAAPFYRVFNPVLQGKKFDPHGDYVRKYVPELRHLAGASVHEPWLSDSGSEAGYPERIVDHAAERVTALEDFAHRT